MHYLHRYVNAQEIGTLLYLQIACQTQRTSGHVHAEVLAFSNAILVAISYPLLETTCMSL